MVGFGLLDLLCLDFPDFSSQMNHYNPEFSFAIPRSAHLRFITWDLLQMNYFVNTFAFACLFVCLLAIPWAALLHFLQKCLNSTGPEDNYVQHFAAENGPTSANRHQRSRKRKGEVENWIFCTRICVKGGHKNGDKSPLSSPTRKFELCKICFPLYKEERWVCFVVGITIPDARHDWCWCKDDMIRVFSMHQEI